MIGLFIVLGVAGALGIAFTPLGKAVKSLIVADTLKNPKAAEGVYLSAIDESQRLYEQASKNLAKLAGMLTEANVEYTKATTDLERTEKQCESLARNNDEEGLKFLAQKRNSLLQRQEKYMNHMLELKPKVEEAQELSTLHQENVIKLQENKELAIADLKLGKSMEQIYASTDKLRASNKTQQLLGQIDNNVKDQKQRAVGEKMIYENRLETKERRLNQRISTSENDEYIKQLMDKYNKN